MIISGLNEDDLHYMDVLFCFYHDSLVVVFLCFLPELDLKQKKDEDQLGLPAGLPHLAVQAGGLLAGESILREVTGESLLVKHSSWRDNGHFNMTN